MISEESPQHSSKTRSSRATSPNLSSSYGTEATVGNKVLDKVGVDCKSKTDRLRSLQCGQAY